MTDHTSVSDALKWGTAQLKLSGIESASLDARLLLSAVTGDGHEHMIAHGETPLSSSDMQVFQDYIAIRKSYKSIARILGRKEFWSLEFELGPDTLEPRPDSECLVEEVLRNIKDRSVPIRILDLGTGTGCLLLSLLSELPNAKGIGVDVASGAIEVATRNAEQLSLSHRATFLTSNWFERVQGDYHVIVSNPPYITTDEMKSLSKEVQGFDPELALHGGADGLAPYRVILDEAARHLTDDGFLVLETSPQLMPQLVQLSAKTGAYEPGKVINDLSGKSRVLGLRKAH